jgi:hypothetical protein
MSWTRVFHLGDLALTLSAACGVAVWLLAGRNWRATSLWSLAFALAIGVVGASKIAFLGWATAMPALQFKALSGHAAGFAAVCPGLCRLLALRHGTAIRTAATAAGMGMGIVVAATLVLEHQHTPAEAAGGWLVGTAASLTTLGALDAARPPAFGTALPAALLAFALCAWMIGAAPIGYWMIRMALALSSNTAPTPWERCG